MELQYIADIPDEDIFLCHAHGHGKTSVLAQVLLLAVDRDEIFGFRQAVNQLQLLLAGMAGNMHLVHGFVNHRAALL